MALYIRKDLLKTPAGEAEQAYLAIHQLISSGKTDEALTALEKFVETYPDFADAHNDLGVLYYEKGEMEKTLSCYEKAVELAPDNTTSLKNLADFYYGELLRSEDAMKLYLKLLKANPEDVDTFLIVGNIAAFWGQMDDARIFYNKVLEIEPWNITAMDNLESLQRYSEASRS